MRFTIPKVPEPVQWLLLSPLILIAVPVVVVMTELDWLHRRLAPYETEYSAWYAWRPVRHFNCVDWFWLETVDRRRVGFFDAFYRARQEPRP